MTREEAITILGDYEYILFEDEDTYNREAFRMAIKALENHDTFMKYAYSQGKADALSQEPCTDAVKVCEIYADVNDCENGAQELCGQCIHYKEPCDDAISREAVKEIICAEFVDTQDGMQEWRNAVNDVVENILHKAEQLPPVTQKSGFYCDTCEIGNPCLYCKHEFEPQESEDKE